MNDKKVFGLVGRNIAYSFSRNYFSEKFKTLALKQHSYQNFDLQNIEEFPSLFSETSDHLMGLNVTIPYKEKIIEFLDEMDEDAALIGAVNTVKIEASGKKIGFNTDVHGFETSLVPLLEMSPKRALILGSGGASKAVSFSLNRLGIPYKFVSRTPEKNQLSYEMITPALMRECSLLINCTPLGTFPDTEKAPALPYACLNASHLLYDLIYNPQETTFLRLGKERGARVKNGLEMLELQAEKSWEIWNR